MGRDTFNQRFFYRGGPFKPASLFVTDETIHAYSLLWVDGRHICSSIYDYNGNLIDTTFTNGDWGIGGVYPVNDGFSESEFHIQAGFQTDSDDITGGFYQIYTSDGQPYRFHDFVSPWWSGDPEDFQTSTVLPRDWYLDDEGNVALSFIGDAEADGGTDCVIICLTATINTSGI